MKNLLPYLVIMAFLGIIACEKDRGIALDNETQNSLDTIFPLSYFPAYPGSYWKYIDSNNDTTVITTNAEYKKDAYSIDGAAFQSDTFYVPFYDQIPIWGYEAHVGPITNSGSNPLRRILSDTLPIGSNWQVYGWGGADVRRKMLAMDTSVTVLSTAYFPTIVIEEYNANGIPPGPFVFRRHYTKNIGLVMEEQYNWQDSTTNTKLLFDYYINQ